MQTESPHVSIDRLDLAIGAKKDELTNVMFMSLEEAATYYVQFREIFDYLDTVRDKWAAVKEELSVKILPDIFERSKVAQSLTLKSGTRVTILYKTMASMKDKEKAMQWLRDNNMGDLIQPTVNASTLASAAKHMAEENQSLPEEFFTTTIKPTTSVTKKK